MLRHPLLVVALREAVQRRPIFVPTPFTMWQFAPSLGLIDLRPMHDVVGHGSHIAGIFRSQLQQKRRQRVQVRIAQLNGRHIAARHHLVGILEVLDHPRGIPVAAHTRQAGAGVRGAAGQVVASLTLFLAEVTRPATSCGEN